ncbi:MAG: Translin [Acidimicrobiales bacterium]|nr:Translin [Acidimicrobiales bacterium]
MVRLASASIRAVHRGEASSAASLAADSEAALREAQSALTPWPVLAASGPLADAEKEYAEARLCAALVDGSSALPSAARLGVAASAWLNGLAEAASELRRNCLDRLREGDIARAEQLLGAMDDVYSQLVTVDHPDAVTAGLRRTTDALRAVLERTRGDLTVTVVQSRLQHALEEHRPAGD